MRTNVEQTFFLFEFMSLWHNSLLLFGLWHGFCFIGCVVDLANVPRAHGKTKVPGGDWFFELV